MMVMMSYASLSTQRFPALRTDSHIGYGRAAVQLARDWNSDPQQLSFANAVKPHSLISMLQDGLAYDDLAASATEGSKTDTTDTAATTARDGRYSFIMNKKRRASDASAPAPLDQIRKRPRLEANETQQTTPETATEPVRKVRGRKKSTAVKAVAEPEGTTDSVEPVTNPTSPADDTKIVVDEPAALVSTLEIGTSTGAQSESVPKATTVLDTTIPDSEILSISWNRSDPAQLTATGSAIWKSWFLPTAKQPWFASQPDVKTVDHAANYGKCFISAAATAKASEAVALAVERKELNAEVIVQTTSSANAENTIGASVKTTVLVPNSDIVLALRWSEKSNQLLVLSAKTAENVRCRVSAWDVPENRFIGEYNLRDTAFDIAWIHDSQFMICGLKFLALATIEPKLRLLKYLEHDQELTAIRWDRHTRRAACISHDEGTIQLVDTKLFSMESKESQDGSVTACEWQPLADDDDLSKLRILATTCHTGIINIWNGRSKLELLHKLDMSTVPAMVLAFSPDGQLIAGAGDDKICIWKTDMAERKPIIVWQAKEQHIREEQVAQTDQMDVDRAEDEERWRIGSLSWNKIGSQLAYSNADKLRVVSVSL